MATVISSKKGKMMEGKPESGGKSLVCFVGSNNLQNKLLISFLQEELNSVEYMFMEELPEEQEWDPKRGILILLDSRNRDPFEKTGIMNEVPEHILKKCLVALFNVPNGNGSQERALKFGIHGILLTTESPANFRKAIHAILAGDLWYPRKAMAGYILKNSQRFVPKENGKHLLTRREKEILLRLASGATNENIADELLISQHTVRTHLYNIFKKIEVGNRVQASLWVARNI